MKPTCVILHCSATPDRRSGHVNAALIDVWHKANGWSGIGYHKVVCRDGRIEVGRSEAKAGAHTKGHNNSIGICYAGTRYPTMDQIESLLKLYDELKTRYGFTWKDWFGHYEFTDKKLCPVFSMNVFRVLLREHDKWTQLRRRNSCPMLTS